MLVEGKTNMTATAITHTFDIREYRVAEFKDKLAKLQRKATKQGFAPLVLTSLGTYEVKRYVSETVTVLDTYAKFSVETAGEFKLAGWSLLGVIDYTVAGVIVREVPGQVVPAEYRSEDATCAHCQTARYRKQTFIVAHEDGRTARVGRNCLADFLGINPETILRSAEWVQTVRGLGDEEGYGGGSSRVPETLSPKTWLAHALRTTAVAGYISKAAAEAYAAKSGGDAQLATTSNRTQTLIDAINGRLPKYTGRYGQQVDQNAEVLAEYGLPEEADYAKAELLLTYGKALQGASTYVYNLKTICNAEFCTARDSGQRHRQLEAGPREDRRGRRQAGDQAGRLPRHGGREAHGDGHGDQDDGPRR
jgi:hypothetical protein